MLSTQFGFVLQQTLFSINLLFFTVSSWSVVTDSSNQKAWCDIKVKYKRKHELRILRKLLWYKIKKK